MAASLSQIVSYVMGGLFALSGALKLYPFIPEPSKQMANDFIGYARVCPSVLLGFLPDPTVYRYCVGALEVFFGLGMCMCPSPRGKSVNIVGLMVIMLGAFQTLICLKQYSLLPVPLIFGFGLGYIWTNIPRAKVADAGGSKKRR